MGPLSAIFIWLTPLPLQQQAHLMAGVFSWVVLWWVFEPVPLPITSIFGTALAVVLGIADVRVAFASFADPIIFLFLGGFLMAQAMTKHGLVQRFALKLLSSKDAERDPRKGLLRFLILTSVISAVMPNTATMAIMMPIGLVIVKSLYSNEKNSQAVFLTALAYATAIGGLITPVGTPPNILTMGIIENLTAEHVSFLGWMLGALPLFFCLGIFNHFYTKDALSSNFSNFDFEGMREDVRSLGSLSIPEKYTLLALIAAIIMWLLPAFAYMLPSLENLPIRSWLDEHLPESLAIILPVCFLFFVSDEQGSRVLNWNDAKSIDWGILLLFGGSLAMGNLIFETGLAQSVGNSLANLFSHSPEWVFISVVAAFTIFLTEVTSNTACAALITPIMIASSRSLGFDPVVHAMVMGFMCSLGFMLPVATPPNTLAFSTGLVPTKVMFRRGFATNVAGWVFGIASLFWLHFIREILTQ